MERRDYYNYIYEKESDEEIDLKEIFYLLKKNKWIFILIILIVFISAYIYLFYSPNIYKAQTTIQIGTSSNKNSQEDIINSALLGYSSNSLETEIYVIKSRSTILEALKNVNMEFRIWGVDKFFRKKELYKEENPFNIEIEKGEELIFKITPLNNKKFRLKVMGNINGSRIEHEKEYAFNKWIKNNLFKIKIDLKSSQEFSFRSYIFQKSNKLYLADKLKNDLNVKQEGKQANILSIAYEDPVPVRAVEFVNEIAKVYIDQNIKRKTLEAERILEFINSQLKIIKRSLQESALKLENFKRKNRTIDISQNILQLSNQLAEYENKYNILTMQLSILKRISQQILKGKNLENLTLAGIGIEDKNLAGLISKLQEAIVKQKSLLKSYTWQHPQVQKIANEINELKKMIYRSVKLLINSLNTKRYLLKKDITKIEKKLEELPKTQKNYLALQRNFMFNEKFYSYLLEKKTETEIKKAATVSQNRILDKAILPKKPVKPKRKLVLIVSFVVGLILAIFIIFLKEFLKDKIESIEDIKKEIGVPIIGTIPFNKKLKKDRRLIVLDDPKSPIAESFRNIRINLQFLLKNKERSIVGITSTLSKEGKSTIISNLGVMISLLEKKVVIVNLDLRKPTLHQFFNINNYKGVSSYLVNSASLEEIIVKSKYNNLDIIPAGPIPPNPAELISSEKVLTLFNELRKRYEIILVDTPPVGLVPDTKLLLTHFDATLYVLRSGYSKKEFLNLIKDLYKDHNIRNLGIILNGVKIDRSKGYGYYGYY